MKLTGLHLLLTYRCTLECDHCFVWGSPRQTGTMSQDMLRLVLAQASEMGTIESIYFEGGEPFMCYTSLLAGAGEAKRRGFRVGIVTNAYWAGQPERALKALQPLAGLVDDLLISNDAYHNSPAVGRATGNAVAAAAALGIPCSAISIVKAPAEPAAGAPAPTGQLPAGVHGVMYRGRAAARLAGRAPHQPWDELTECPYEDLREPGRIHVDPYGNVHICQGIALGNVRKASLAEICATYVPEEHPITGALLAGGPAELVRRFGLPCQAAYAGACHLCDEARRRLRPSYAESLMPDEMYGVPSAGAYRRGRQAAAAPTPYEGSL
jgi:hypothetical protein